MKKVVLLGILASCMAIMIGCSLGNAVIPPDQEPVAVNYNLALNGDFEAFNVDDTPTTKGWGGDNGKIIQDNGNKVLALTPGSTDPAFVFYKTFNDFSASAATATARIKLSNSVDAAKVTFSVEKSDATTDPVLGVFTENPVETTDWQNVTLTVPTTAVAYFSTIKVTVDPDCGEVLVDDISLTPSTPAAINFVAFGDFEGNLDGKWKCPYEGIVGDWPDPQVTSGVVSLSYSPSTELITSTPWLTDMCMNYPTVKAGVLRVRAKGEGTILLVVERKDNDSVTAAPIMQEYPITNDFAEYSLTIPKEAKNWHETTVKVKALAGAGDVQIDYVKLNVTE